MGETLYVLESIEEPEPGGAYTVAVSYVSGSLLDTGGSDETQTALIVLGVVVVALLIGLVFAVRSQMQRGGSSDEDADEDADDLVADEAPEPSGAGEAAIRTEDSGDGSIDDE
jgi:hypothetical protein